MDRYLEHERFGRQSGLKTGPLLCCCAALLVMAGCDDRPAPPPPLPDTPSTRPASTLDLPVAPTTQELVSGKQKTIQLGTFPLSLDVPNSWKIASTSNSLWVEGYAPGGEIRLLLTPQGDPLKPAMVKAWEVRVSKESTTNPSSKLLHSSLRPIGGNAKAFDRREVNTVNVTRDNGTIERIDFVDWSIDVMVPQGNAFTLDLIHFTGLTKEQYEKDREFLEKILATLHYDALPGTLE